MVQPLENTVKCLGIHVGVDLKTTPVAVSLLLFFGDPLFTEVIKLRILHTWSPISVAGEERLSSP